MMSCAVLDRLFMTGLCNVAIYNSTSHCYVPFTPHNV